MIREVHPDDAETLARIYNIYVNRSTATFDTEPLSVAAMREKIENISARYPFFVYEEQSEVVGFCYAHMWKEKAAYQTTAETTVYLAPEATGSGIGRFLLLRLIEACRIQGLHSLIACVTQGNAASDKLHVNLGFKKVSHFSKVGRKFDQWLDVVDYELEL